MLDKIDDYLIDRVAQPVADRLADKIKVNKLAASFFMGASIFLLGQQYIIYLQNKLSVISAIIIPIVLVYLTTRYINAEKRECKTGVMPTERISDMLFRKIMLVFAFFGVFFTILIYFFKTFGMENIFSILYDWSLIFALYFIACRDNPPKQQREAALDRGFVGANGNG